MADTGPAERQHLADGDYQVRDSYGRVVTVKENSDA